MGLPKKLTEQQIKFANLLICEEGRKTATQCAIEAGYAKRSAFMIASRLQNVNKYPHLLKAIDSEVTFVDIELSIDTKDRNKLMKSAEKSNSKVIASIHETKATPNAEEIVNLVKENKDNGDIVKFCSFVSNHRDALQILEAANSLVGEESNHCLMGLGNGGDWVRLHAPVLGQEMVYATMQNSFRLSDKGLINVRDLRDAWALMEY